MNENFLYYIVGPDDPCRFLRDVLKSQMRISHSLLTKLKAQHKIKVNGVTALTNYTLQTGDRITVDIILNEKNNIEPMNLPLDIVYEDIDLLVINKPPGLAVHPGKDRSIRTLANAVTNYWAQQGHVSLFRPINRLDKQTSGLILIGKSQYAHQAIFRQQKQGLLHRSYQALVEGLVQEDSGSINLPIAHPDPEHSQKRSVEPDGKPAFTHFTVIKRYPGYTLLALTLGSGRTHQIRVHLSHLGHPVCGDSLYGRPSQLITRQALHARQLSVQQPRSGTHLYLQADLPPDMAALLEDLNTSGR
ncbi:MAG TPA: RluA family pseudouridine synthase [Syntrophomonadaceae bacterium]|nr:RluA family pseudouridine synthase [Syntrophomonadaceae bacterium]